jgi:hypothetical protein
VYSLCRRDPHSTSWASRRLGIFQHGHVTDVKSSIFRVTQRAFEFAYHWHSKPVREQVDDLNEISELGQELHAQATAAWAQVRTRSSKVASDGQQREEQVEIKI